MRHVAPSVTVPPPHAGITRVVAALALVAASAIHAGFAPAHTGEQILRGLFFAGAAAFQLAGAVIVLRPPSRRALSLVSDGNTTIVAMWLISRVAGPIVAPDAGWAEPVAFADTLCTVLELSAVTLLRVGAGRRAEPSSLRHRRIGRATTMAVVAALGLGLVPLVAAAVATADSHASPGCDGGTGTRCLVHDAASAGRSRPGGGHP